MKRIELSRTRKIILFFIFVLIMLLFFICALLSKKESMEEISLKEFEELLSERSYSIVYYGQEDCGACNTLLPYILEEAKELKQYIYYLNAENSSCGETLERFGVVYTPSIIIIDDGKVRVYDDFGVNEIRDILLESTISIKDWSNSFSFISYEELKKKMNGNVDFFLYIGREDCRDCRSFNPIIKEYVAEPNGVGIYYFDLKVFRDKAMMKNASSADIEFYNSIKNTFNIEWVPSVYHIRNGEIVSKYEYLDEQYYLIEKAEKKEEIEQEFVNRFYAWIEEEKKSSR